MTDFLVIGSGPSGVAVAHALLARGRRVTMIDAGRIVSAADPALQDRLSAGDPRDWTDADRSAWRTPQFTTPAGQVRRFGSDAGMEAGAETYSTGSAAVALRSSHAVGGLSTLWGGAVRAYDAADLNGWPVTADQLVPHYQAVARIVPIAGPSDDALARHVGPDIGPQARHVLARAPGSGPVRLRAASTAVGAGCRSCGMCLHGCPWGQIWQAGSALPALAENPAFTYRSGVPVRAIAETADGVSVHLADGSTLTAARVILATGVLETARLLLQTGWSDELTLRDSQFAFLPFVMARRIGPVDRLPLTTLPKIFADIDLGQDIAHPAHAQIYGWNEFYLRDLVANYGHGIPGAAAALNMVAHRMMVAQIFLHSDLGAQIRLRLAGDGKLQAETRPGEGFAAAMAQAQDRLVRHLRAAGLHGLRRASRTAAPGASFHVGASVPMARVAGKGSADLTGRPFGLERIHVVDASVLPAIPAATITLSVMANAHRIGTALGQ